MFFIYLFFSIGILATILLILPTLVEITIYLISMFANFKTAKENSKEVKKAVLDKKKEIKLAKIEKKLAIKNLEEKEVVEAEEEQPVAEETAEEEKVEETETDAVVEQPVETTPVAEANTTPTENI